MRNPDTRGKVLRLQTPTAYYLPSFSRSFLVQLCKTLKNWTHRKLHYYLYVTHCCCPHTPGYGVKLYSLIRYNTMNTHTEVESTLPRPLISTPDEGHFTKAGRAMGSEGSPAVWRWRRKTSVFARNSNHGLSRRSLVTKTTVLTRLIQGYR